MSSIRLRPDQVEHLRRSDPDKEIKLAVARWRAGEIVVGNCNKRQYGQNLLQFNIWKRPEGVTDAQIREILDEHWRNPVHRPEELKKHNAAIAAMMPAGPYIVEEW